MKIRPIALLLSAVCLLCGCGKTEQPENPYRLKQTTVEYYYRDRKTFTWEFVDTYDENGWLVENQEFENGIADTKTLYEHDAYGNITRTTQIHPDGTRDVGEEVLTLDKNHRVIYSESTWNGEPSATTQYGYNDDGQITQLYINRIDVRDGEDWKSFVDRTYDPEGRLIRKDTRWEPDNNNTSYTLYHYEQDRLLRTETFKEEELDTYTDYTYDESGLVQTAVSFDANGVKERKQITTFDEYGNELEVISYFYASERMRYGETDEEPDRRTTYVYESKNHSNP